MGTRLESKQPVPCLAFFQFYFNVFVPEIGQNSSLGSIAFFLVSPLKQIRDENTLLKGWGTHASILHLQCLGDEW